jgi:xylulokinase
VVPDRFVTLAYFPSGIMVKWFHDMLFANGKKMHAQDCSGSSEAEHYEFLEGQCAGRPSGLCVTPHLIGSGNPEFNPHARGVISGLGPETTSAQIYRGIIEGLACELALITDVLERAVGAFQDIYVSGGGARSALGLRLRAALTQRRLHVMTTREAVCLGTAILAGIAAGEYRDFAEAVEQVVQEESVVEPDSSLTSSYQEQHDRYRLLRSAMITQVYA